MKNKFCFFICCQMKVVILVIPELVLEATKYYINGVVSYLSHDTSYNTILEELLCDGYIITGQSKYSHNGTVWTFVKDE